MKASEFDNTYCIGNDQDFFDPIWPICKSNTLKELHELPPQEEDTAIELGSECVLDSMIDSEEADPYPPDSQVMRMPNLQTMSNYIKFHYARTISGDLCKWIDRGEGGNWSGQDFPVSVRNTVEITGFDFWWSARTNLISDVSVSVDVLFPGQASPKHQEYIVSLFFDFQNRIRLIHEKFICSGDYIERYGMFRLSKYLVPIFKKYEIDKQAEILLKQHNPKALEKQAENDPEELVEKLGLTIQSLPLFGCSKTRSILFFKKDTVEVSITDYSGRIMAVKTVSVAPKTIVINKSAVGKTSHKLDIFHECIHYEWHYMFFRLQDMYNNDLRKLENMKRIIIKRLESEKEETNPLCWLEFQAKRGSFALWMPEQMMRAQIRARMTDPHVSGLNSGQIYQRIAGQIARELTIPKFRIRARLIQLGHWLAMGCLNFEGDHYVAPFSFVAEDAERDYTYFITRKQFYELYQSNAKFRQQTDTGRFIYVEGHLCLNQPEYVYQTDDGPMMTKAALARVDLCCLRFKNQYWHDASYVYCHGRLNCDDNYNQKFFYFPPVEYNKKNPKPALPEQILLNEAYLNDMPRSFSKQLSKLMEDCNVTVEELAWRSTVSGRTINNYCSEKYHGYTLENVLAIVFALHLPPWVSEEFLRAAGFDITTSPESIKYSSVLRTMFMDSVKTVNDFLQTIGLRLIGERKEKKLEELGSYEA